MTYSKAIPLLFACAVLCYLTGPGTAWGHATGENYVWLNVDESHLTGRFEVHFRDLREKRHLELPSDNDAAAEAIEETAPQIHEYIREHFRILARGEVVPLEFTETKVHELPIGTFAEYHYRTPDFDVPDKLTIQNNLFFEGDRFHRSLIVIEYNKKTGERYGGEFGAMIFSPSRTEQQFDLLNVEGLLRPWDFVWQGMLHIWIGIDHILFLLALLLPAVLIRNDSGWAAVPGFRAALWNIIKIVTVFTIAHSITLTLAALDIVSLPSRLVESVIALSIVLVTLNAIFPRFRESNWLIIFFFGLFHGLGFASVMGELEFRIAQLVKVMLAFNVGVEIGQIAIVACAFPVIFLLRKSQVYLPVVLKGGSALICLVASYWFVERAFGI